MKDREAINILWSKATALFLEIENMDLLNFLDRLIEVIKNNEELIHRILSEKQYENKYKFMKNERDFFQYIINIDPKMYIIASTGDDFVLIVKNYIGREHKSELEVLRIILNLIKDMITYTSKEVCPQCKSDHLRIFTDSSNKEIYKHCETCFFTSKNNKPIQAEKTLFPANIQLLKSEGYLS